MRFFFITLTFIAAAVSSAAQSPSISQIADKLAKFDRYDASASYEVLLPSSDEPIVYNLELHSQIAPDDTLAPVSYLIDRSTADDQKSEGFSAYFGGHYYRFHNLNLQEFHFGDDPTPFTLGSHNDRGIQNQAQFTELLPQYIARTLSSMESDTTYKYRVHPDTIISGRKVTAIDGVRSFRGIIATKFLYTFVPESFTPLSMERIANPGSIGEQIITATYSPNASTQTLPLDESTLSSIYPQAFEKYRQANFTFDNIIGRRMPDFSLPSPGGDRYNLDNENSFVRPTVIALLDTDYPDIDVFLSRLRRAIDNQAQDIDLLTAFVENNAERVTEAAGKLRPHEYLLMSARGLCRKLGVEHTPAIIACSEDLTVIAAASSFDNNNIENVVIKLAEQTADNNL